jgi:hypothetical protein
MESTIHRRKVLRWPRWTWAKTDVLTDAEVAKIREAIDRAI